MLGESCWGAFRDRVQAQYNYSLYTCHQRQIDGMQRGKFSACVAESEQLCVAPYCKPRTAVLRMRDGATPQTSEAPGSTFVALSPPPSAALPPLDEEPTYPGPGVVLLGCEGCGVPELSRSLAGSHLVQLASTEAGEPSWRSRQVNFFDHEARYLLGEQWYMRRWPIRRGQRAVGMDGSGSYLQSPEAAARLAARLSPATTSLLVLLRDPLARAVRRWTDLQRRSDYLRGASFEAKMYSEVKELSRCFEAERVRRPPQPTPSPPPPSPLPPSSPPRPLSPSPLSSLQPEPAAPRATNTPPPRHRGRRS